MSRLARSLAVWIGLLWACCSSFAYGSESIVIGAEDSWYPYSGVVDGQPSGYTLDLVKAAFATQGIEVKFVSLPYIRCMNDVREGRLLACFNTARAPMVEKDYLWPAKPMFQSSSLIFARAGSGQSGLGAANLEGKSVAVTRGYEYGEAFDQNAKIHRQPAPNDLSCLRMLLDKRVDYALVYDRVSERLIVDYSKEFSGKLVPVGRIETLQLYTVFSKGFPDSRRYLALFDKGFAAISNDGTMAALNRRWWH